VYFGETAINLDAKGRLAIPARYRDSIQAQCGGRLVLTYSAFDSGALWLYPENEWERVRDEVTGLSTFNPGHRSLQRKLVGSATAVEPDGSGRIQLPLTLRQVAGLEKRVVMMGMRMGRTLVKHVVGRRFEPQNVPRLRQETIARDEQANNRNAAHTLRFQSLHRVLDCGSLGHAEGDLYAMLFPQGRNRRLHQLIPARVAAVSHNQDSGPSVRFDSYFSPGSVC